MTQDETRQPIGFWLRRIDELLTGRMNDILHGEGMTRFHWQALNLLAERGVTTVAELHVAMRDFVSEDEAATLVADLAKLGWAEEHDDSLTLTSAGRTQHQRVSGVIGEIRRAAVAGISEAEYVTMIRSLQKMAQNLEEMEK